VSVPTILFSESEIETLVRDMARAIAAMPSPPEIMAPILVGAFVFAADLARALSREGIDLEIEFLWLRSYGDARKSGAMDVRAGPSDAVRGRHVLLIDGVLDHGHTLMTARDLLMKAGAACVTTAVVVDKTRKGAPIAADFACFTGVDHFIIGYGMDDAGFARGLPYIAKVE